MPASRREDDELDDPGNRSRRAYDDADSVDEPRKKKKKKMRSSGNSAAIVAVAALAVVLLAALGVGIWWFTRESSPPSVNTQTPKEKKPAEESKLTASDPKELEQLKGTWDLVAFDVSGKPTPADEMQKIKYVFEGNKVTLHLPGQPDESSHFSVDGTSNPKKMTIYFTFQRNKSSVQRKEVRALYEIKGDTLRMCLIPFGNEFPAELVSREGTNLMTLKRR